MCLRGSLSVCLIVVFVITLTSVRGKMLDLTHVLNNRSQHYQLFRDFELQSAIKGNMANLGGMWVEANNLLLNEHTGTHIDAPAHTWETGIHMHEIPMADLIGPAIVISVTEQGKTNRDYPLTKQDVLDFERKHGRIPDGSILLLETDGAKDYWTPTVYLGTETVKDSTSMHFPGFGGPVVEWLIEERNIKGLGADRMSFDIGDTTVFPVHLALLSRGKFGIENMNNLNKLPPVGATVIVAALPIEGGSGSPSRIVAFWDTDLPVYDSAMGRLPKMGIVGVGFAFASLLCF